MRANQDGMVRYPNFDILRLFLASEVAFVHAWWTVDRDFEWHALIMAVPAFLAISGFLVLQSYEQTGSWRRFIRKRFLRIVPALLLSFAVCFVLFNWHMVANSFLNWLTGGLYTMRGPANGPLWSLAWEELAYSVLALLWIAGAYKRPLVIWGMLLVSALIVSLATGVTPHTRIIMFLAPAFFIGNLMYLHKDRLLNINALIPWIMLATTIYFRSELTRYADGLILLVLQSVSVVWVGMAGFRLMRFKFPDISYSVYIFHMPLLIWIKLNWSVESLPEMLLMLSVTLLPICLFSWYFVEKPALGFKNQSVREFVNCWLQKACAPSEPY
jgi:peptidoglycan/LPS O-acetylase OafA/YrhL